MSAPQRKRGSAVLGWLTVDNSSGVFAWPMLQEYLVELNVSDASGLQGTKS
jgi:hypothetical protein